MTDSPVAAANARTMWKREIPPTPAISSRVSSPARWLSINQSAFWAGFMDQSLHSKRRHHAGFARASFDSPCCRPRLCETGTGGGLFRSAKHSSRAIACNTTSIVHTEPAFNPTAHQSCPYKDCLSLGQHVREDDDAPPCLEPWQIDTACGTCCRCGRNHRPCAEEIRS